MLAESIESITSQWLSSARLFGKAVALAGKRGDVVWVLARPFFEDVALIAAASEKKQACPVALRQGVDNERHQSGGYIFPSCLANGAMAIQRSPPDLGFVMSANSVVSAPVG